MVCSRPGIGTQPRIYSRRIDTSTSFSPFRFVLLVFIVPLLAHYLSLRPTRPHCPYTSPLSTPAVPLFFPVVLLSCPDNVHLFIWRLHEFIPPPKPFTPHHTSKAHPSHGILLSRTEFMWKYRSEFRARNEAERHEKWFTVSLLVLAVH